MQHKRHWRPASYSQQARIFAWNQISQYLYYKNNPEQNFSYSVTEWVPSRLTPIEFTAQANQYSEYIRTFRNSYRCSMVKYRALKCFLRHTKKYCKSNDVKVPLCSDWIDPFDSSLI